MIKKHILFAVLYILTCSTLKAQETHSHVSEEPVGKEIVNKSFVKDYIKAMPEDVIPILTKNNILDCIDFIDNNVKAEITNRMQGKSEMTHLGQTMASFRLTSSTKADIKLLPKGSNDVMIYVVTTSATDSVFDSCVRVYDKNWTLVEDKFQFHIPHPSRFTHLTLFEEDDTMNVYELECPLRFEGESESDHPDIINEYTLSWNPDQGLFNINNNK